MSDAEWSITVLICGNEESFKDILYILPSIPPIRFHSHPASLDKEKTPTLKLTALSFFRSALTNALQ